MQWKCAWFKTDAWCSWRGYIGNNKQTKTKHVANFLSDIDNSCANFCPPLPLQSSHAVKGSVRLFCDSNPWIDPTIGERRYFMALFQMHYIKILFLSDCLTFEQICLFLWLVGLSTRYKDIIIIKMCGYELWIF